MGLKQKELQLAFQMKLTRKQPLVRIFTFEDQKLFPLFWLILSYLSRINIHA